MSKVARFVFAMTGALSFICAAAPLAAQTYCSSSSTNMYYEWISRVEINGAERTSGKEGFNDQSGTSLTTLAIGGSYPVEVDVSTNTGPYTEYVKIWFDLNHDGVFADPGELIFNKSLSVPSSSTSTFFANIAIPACALPGPTRLRVIMQYASNPKLCGTYTYGETEDYMVTITGSEATPTSASSSFTIDEDSTYTFNASSFPFNDTDPGQTMKNVVIASLPTSGTLKLNGAAVTAGQAISSSDISAGGFVFEPPANANGTPFGSFTFSVTDCVDKQSPTYTMTANVSSVADAPTISPIANQTMSENQTLGPLAFTVNDVETGAASVTVTAESSNDAVAPLSSLQLGGSGANRTLTITPPANKFGSATITLTASDGSLTATTSFVLTVNGVNDAPVLAANTGVTLSQAATVTISSSELQVTDVENTPTEITYHLTASPAHGTLRVAGSNLSGGSSFTQSAIDAGSLTYANNGDGATSDSFRFTVSDGAGGSIPEQAFTILVQPWISIADISVTETNSTSTATVIASLSGTWAGPVSVSWTTNDGSATAGNDYVAGSGTASIPAGSTQASIPITILGDNLMKPSRSFQVKLSAPSGGTLQDDTATITIDDDDPMPSLSLSGGSAIEGHASTSTASFLVSLSEPSGLAVTFDYATVSGSATSPTDFTAASGVGTISAGAVTTMIDVVVFGDYEVEDDESFSLQVSNVSWATASTSSATWTILSDDHAPVLAANTGVSLSQAATVTITSSELQVTDVENTPTEITYHLTASPAHGTLRVAGSNLSGGSSFTQSAIDAGSLTYANNGDGATSDSFRFTVSDGAGGSIPEQAFTILVQPWISIADISVTETNSTSTATVIASLSGTWAGPVSVSWTTNDGSATAGTDYVAGSGTASIPAGSTQASIPITILGDNLMKPSRSFQVKLSAPSGGTLQDDTATITIDDDDPMPSLSISGGSAIEGDASTSTASFLVSLSETSGIAVTFDYATVSGSATSPTDFTAASGVGTIPAGAVTTMIDVVVFGDYEVEDDESFSLQVSNVSWATASTSSATWTILSDDHAPIATNDSASLDEDQTLVVPAPGLLANDSDADDDVLTVSIVTQPAHGVLSANDDGSFSYKPASDYFGDDSFTYRASDGQLASNIAAVSLTIHSVNDSPVAEADSGTTPEDTNLTIPVTTLLENDSDVENDDLTVVSVTSPSVEGGSVEIANGSIIYRPASDFGGLDSFLYTISDGNGGTASAKVVVDVTRLVNVGVSIAGPAEVTPGTEGSWTVTVSNTGPSDAEGLTLVVPTPTGLILTGSACSPCTKMNLAEGATTSFEMKADVPSSSSGSFTIEASVTSTTSEAEPGDNADSLEVNLTNPVADLAASMTAPDTLVPGTAAQFVVTVSNAGPSDLPAANLAIVLPDSFVETSRSSSSSDSATEGWSLVAGSSVSWTIDGTIDPAARGSVSATASVAASTPAVDPVSSNDSAARTATLEPRVSLVPSITHDREPAVLDRGVEWTLTVTNEGPSTATGLTFDLTAADLELGSPDNGILESLQPGASASVTIDSTATALPRATLAAVIGAAEPLDASAAASDEVSVRPALADLTASITALVSATRVGERFPIEILVTNNGPEEAIDAVLTLEGETRAQLLSMAVVDSPISSSRRVELGTIEKGSTVVLTGEALTREAGRVEITLLATSGWDDPDPDSAEGTLFLDADPTSYSTVLPFAEDGIDASGSRRRTVIALGNLGFMTSRTTLRQTHANGSEAASDMNWLAAGESPVIETPLARRSSAYSSGWIVASAEDVSKIGAFHTTAWIETASRGVETYCPVRPGTVMESDVWLHGLSNDMNSRAIVAIVNIDTVRPLDLDLEIYPADGSGSDARTLLVSVGPGQLTMIEPLDRVGFDAASVRVHPRIPVPHNAEFLAWAMTEDRVSGDRAWRSPIVELSGTGDRIAAIPPAGGDTIVLEVANPTSDPLRVRLTLDGDVERELSLGAREARRVDLSSLAVEDRYGILRVTFFDGAGARTGLAWATLQRAADGGGLLFEETAMPFVNEGISAGTMHPGRLQPDRTARVLVVNPNDDTVHVTLSLLDANDGSVIKTLTSLIEGRSASLLSDVARYLTDRPGYLQIETAGGERVFTELLIDPLDENRGRTDTLHVPTLADE